jgi:putative transferase (TIGR04331 family)
MNKDTFFKEFNLIKKNKFDEFKKILKTKSNKDYEIILKLFSKILNKYHNTSLSPENWSRIIGPWLKYILDIYNHKELLIKHSVIFKKYFKNKKINKVIVPKDFTQFVGNQNTNSFNQSIFLYQLYDNNNFSLTKLKKEFRFSNLFFIFYIFFFNLLNKLSLNNNKLVVIDNNKSKKIKTLKDKIVFFPYTNLRYLNIFNDDFKLREKFIKNLKKKPIKHNKKIIFCLANCPTDYLENFKFNKILSRFLISGKKFYCRVSHLDNEFFKIYTAFKKNCKIYLDQHGGNFSFVNEKLYLFYEKKISKKIYFWDKISNKQNNSKFMSFKINEINNDKNLYKKKYNVCFVLSYLKEYDFQNEFHENYDYDYKLSQLKDFFHFLNDSSNSVIKIPANRYDNQIKKSDFYNLGFKKNQILESKSTFFESNILVFEHLSTVLFETRKKDIPFIIILKKKNFFLSNKGKNILNKFKKENLLFEKGKDAALFLNSLNNFEEWWKSKNKFLTSIFYN